MKISTKITGFPGTELSSATEVATAARPGTGVSQLAKGYAELPVLMIRERVLANGVVVDAGAASPAFVPVTADLLNKQVPGSLSSLYERSP